MLKVYQENTETARQLPMGIQKTGTIEDVRAWTRLYKETADELGYGADGRHNAAARVEISLIVCRKLLAS